MPTVYTYWISTALLSLLYLSSAALYVAKREYVEKAQAGPWLSGDVPRAIHDCRINLGPLAILARFDEHRDRSAVSG
ncbi:transmembrane protein [Agrobacterium tumefaciens]|nr:transmembrane protein [Agrobacterium tumefaciens]